MINVILGQVGGGGVQGGITGPDAPKMQALPEWGGGLTLAWIFVKDLSTCTEGPQR